MGVPSFHSPSVVFEMVSCETPTAKKSLPVSITVKQTPEQQIDAPISMVDVSNDVSISNRQSPVLVTERTHPKSVIIPVNIGFSA